VEPYVSLLKLFEGHLQNYRHALRGKVPAELYEPEDYILGLGGKRLRPLLALIGCELFEGDPKRALDVALAIELFHNFSLVHDDILDAAPLRRNSPSVHAKWNTNTAILAGDAILIKSLVALNNYEPLLFKKLSTLLYKTAIEVCEGQQLDMNFETEICVSVDAYIKMISLKTGVLLGCALQMGALCSENNLPEKNELYEFGLNLGIAFQLLDDCLDAFPEGAAQFGKQKGGDILANKKTFLLLKAMELAEEPELSLLNNCLGKDQNPDYKVNTVIEIYNKLKIKELCLAEADKFTRIALKCLENTNAHEERKHNLINFSLELLNRKK
jgi:geranylgeranyl diphosphate synthase, type II